LLPPRQREEGHWLTKECPPADDPSYYRGERTRAYAAYKSREYDCWKKRRERDYIRNK
jgi:hypothetical protein